MADGAEMTEQETEAYLQRLHERAKVGPDVWFRLAIMQAIAKADGFSCDGPSDPHYGKLADAVIDLMIERGIDLSKA